jgi:hypothetical protein
MDDLFGHWLAGFIDGEGTFQIQHHPARRGARAHVSLRFSITLRNDDIAILEEIAERTGLGLVRRRRPRNHDSQPQATWRVGRKDECLRLVELLDRYPLRAKKRHDYTIWREAALLWNAVDSRTATNDWGPLLALIDRLKSGRRYAPPDKQTSLELLDG